MSFAKTRAVKLGGGLRIISSLVVRLMNTNLTFSKVCDIMIKMRRVGDPYETVGLIGSFRRHMPEITQAHRTFTDAGFAVLAPKKLGTVVNPGADFVLLETDATTDPRVLEGEYQEALVASDVVYVVNPGGYLGASAMLELGRLVDKSDAYFMEEPAEPVIAAMAQQALSVVSVEGLVRQMTAHNETFTSREWYDANWCHGPSFTFADQMGPYPPINRPRSHAQH